MDFLNTIEKSEIEKFLENTTLKEAVKKVLLSGIYFNGTLKEGEKANATRNFALALASVGISQGITDEVLGQDIRARAVGIGLLEDAFSQLETLKKVEVVKEKVKNPAR